MQRGAEKVQGGSQLASLCAASSKRVVRLHMRSRVVWHDGGLKVLRGRTLVCSGLLWSAVLCFFTCQLCEGVQYSTYEQQMSKEYYSPSLGAGGEREGSEGCGFFLRLSHLLAVSLPLICCVVRVVALAVAVVVVVVVVVGRRSGPHSCHSRYMDDE